MRPNKAVDRQMFIELLSRVRLAQEIRDCTYVSFGGPFLEDFRLMHSHFGMERLISLEIDPEVLARQQFNQPMSCVSLLQQSSGDFIATYRVEGQSIIWLDYASPKDLRVQIQEVQALLPKLGVGDVVKITVNANPDSLVRSGGGRTVDDLAPERFAELSRRIGDLLPSGANETMMTSDELPQLLFRTLSLQTQRAMKGTGHLFIPLTAFHYTDSHTMLTAAGIVLRDDEQEIAEFLKKTGLDAWEFSVVTKNASTEIMVPALSTRERLFLDKLLPKNNSDELRKELNFLFEEGEERTLRTLTSYARFYRHYPYFSRIVP